MAMMPYSSFVVQDERIVRFRVLLSQTACSLGRKDREAIAFIYGLSDGEVASASGHPAEQLSDNGLRLLETLYRSGVFSHADPQPLVQLLNDVGRKDLALICDEYAKEVAAKCKSSECDAKNKEELEVSSQLETSAGVCPGFAEQNFTSSSCCGNHELSMSIDRHFYIAPSELPQQPALVVSGPVPTTLDNSQLPLSSRRYRNSFPRPRSRMMMSRTSTWMGQFQHAAGNSRAHQMLGMGMRHGPTTLPCPPVPLCYGDNHQHMLDADSGYGVCTMCSSRFYFDSQLASHEEEEVLKTDACTVTMRLRRKSLNEDIYEHRETKKYQLDQKLELQLEEGGSKNNPCLQFNIFPYGLGGDSRSFATLDVVATVSGASHRSRIFHGYGSKQVSLKAVVSEYDTHEVLASHDKRFCLADMAENGIKIKKFVSHEKLKRSKSKMIDFVFTANLEDASVEDLFTMSVDLCQDNDEWAVVDYK